MLHVIVPRIIVSSIIIVRMFHEMESTQKGFDVLQKNQAGLASNEKHAIVNGTSHASIAYKDETANHVLRLISIP